MHKVLVVDDEKPAREEIVYLLDMLEDFQVVGETSTGAETIRKVLDLSPDLVFLDIKMPDMDGFTVARELIKLPTPPQIVFVTAYDQYAVKAFEINAVDYLLKPVTKNRLSNTLSRFLQQDSSQMKRLISLLNQQAPKKQLHRVAVNKNDKVIIIPPEDITFVETEGKSTVVHTEQKKQYHSRYNLSELEYRLKDLSFFRIHRSYLINLEKITEVIPWFHNTYQVRIAGHDQPIPVSRKQIKEFKKILNI
ncbi:LytTR family DNA-binding domain-containing protein [Metallumcola ferriviriculae]|uniref:Stage 0 sporulation protein A homolog n=1 Tax=Metallumcola ferriviriculae TaxID=3039180 RepID=A0AAU0UMB3_9FIRM|nr:LytTR family DNA-binding domain-containing protein [Desulfitibacteraceae bacterium MK1]